MLPELQNIFKRASGGQARRYFMLISADSVCCVCQSVRIPVYQSQMEKEKSLIMTIARDVESVQMSARLGQLQ